MIIVLVTVFMVWLVMEAANVWTSPEYSAEDKCYYVYTVEQQRVEGSASMLYLTKRGRVEVVGYRATYPQLGLAPQPIYSKPYDIQMVSEEIIPNGEIALKRRSVK